MGARSHLDAPRRKAPHLSDCDFSQEEKDIGDRFREIYASGKYSGEFNLIKDVIAREMGYPGGYITLPSGVRSYLSHKAREAKSVAENFRADARIRANLSRMRTDWLAQYATDPAFHHAMTHPEDGDSFFPDDDEQQPAPEKK
jgi:hypothetical protein